LLVSNIWRTTRTYTSPKRLYPNEKHQIAETVEERAWPGQLVSVIAQKDNCEGLIGLFKDTFSIG